jgi:hypothetical protein
MYFFRVCVIWIALLIGCNESLRTSQNIPRKWRYSSSKTCSSQKSVSSLQVMPTAVVESGIAIASVVAFHEAGHFLAARLQGRWITQY